MVTKLYFFFEQYMNNGPFVSLAMKTKGPHLFDSGSCACNSRYEALGTDHAQYDNLHRQHHQHLGNPGKQQFHIRSAVKHGKKPCVKQQADAELEQAYRRDDGRQAVAAAFQQRTIQETVQAGTQRQRRIPAIAVLKSS